MTSQEMEKPKQGSLKKLQIQPDSKNSEEYKDSSMAIKSSVHKNPNSRNRATTEPKKMLKKMRSIRLPKLSSFKSSTRQAKPQSDCQSTDSSSSSDSSPNYFSPDHIKNKNIQRGSESEGTSASSSSSRSAATDDLKSLRQLSYVDDVSDAPPNYSDGRKTQFQASPRNSVSSISSSDNSGNSSPISNSGPSNQKYMQTLANSSSLRTVRKLQNKTSFKAKGSSGRKGSHNPQDSSINRATCSSTLKDSKFPKKVDLHPGQSESEKLSAMKVCTYHHCSLHGHSHAPEAPPKRLLYKRRHSMKSRKSEKSKSLSTDAVAFSQCQHLY